ncbi:MAG: preprotein translocase subunit SecG [Clostridia bacterium]|nr:preprotein translocase subunit SecG [Clostridia bacterium]
MITFGGIVMFGMSWADTIRIFLMILFVIVCIVLTVIVLMQESKSSGLSGTIAGAADSYWGRNKGRSAEGKLVVITKCLVAAFFIIALVLNMNF